PVAVRTVEFPRGAASEKVVAQLLKAGGRRAYIDGSTLRALVAFQKFRPAFPDARITAWLRRDRPLTTLEPMMELFDLERLRGAQIKAAVSEQPAHARTRTPESGVPIAPAAATAEAVAHERVASAAKASGARKRTASGKRGRGRPPSNGA